MPDHHQNESLRHPGGARVVTLGRLGVSTWEPWRGYVSERTLVLIKPDAVRRGLVGEVIGRPERKGLTVDAMTLRTMDVALADQHYAEHVERPYYPALRDFMTSGPLVSLVVSGDEAITVVRTPIGA